MINPRLWVSALSMMASTWSNRTGLFISCLFSWFSLFKNYSVETQPWALKSTLIDILFTFKKKMRHASPPNPLHFPEYAAVGSLSCQPTGGIWSEKFRMLCWSSLEMMTARGYCLLFRPNLQIPTLHMLSHTRCMGTNPASQVIWQFTGLNQESQM